MKKVYLTMFSLAAFTVLQAQVGVNTETPKTTLHVTPTKTDGTTAEGIIAPNLTRAQLIGKDARYVSDQRGAIVYITAIDGTASTKTTKVTAIGYYYFDGAAWQPFGSQSAIVPTEPWKVQGSGALATSNTENIYQAGKVLIGTDGSGGVASEALYVGGKSILTDNVGIGKAPHASYKLDVAGDVRTKNILLPLDNMLSINTEQFNYDSQKMVHYGFKWTGDSWEPGGASYWLSGYGGIKLFTAGQYRLGIKHGGVLQYPGNGAAAGNVLTSDAAGYATWTALPATATTEPWKVQSSTMPATSNTQNIYQAGKVAVGVSLPGHSASETFYVGGTSMLNGAVGINKTFDTSGKYMLDVNGDIRTKQIDLQEDNLLGMGLTDQFTFDSKKMGHYAQKWTGDSWSPGGASYWLSGYGGIRMFTQGTYRLGITHEGVLQYPGNGAAAGAVLTSDASGKATWKNPGKSSGNWFYLPSINLDMGSTTAKTIDLFDKGVKQLLANPFLAAGLPGAASDYFYIIIGQSGHITVNGLDGNGVLNYTPTTTTPPAEAYLNIVVAVK